MPKAIDLRKDYHKKLTSLLAELQKEAAKGKNTPGKTKLKALLKGGMYIQAGIPFNSLLFIGIGASSGKNKETTCETVGEIRYETAEGLNAYSYYRELREIACNNHLPFAHIDLTLFRETRQTELKALMREFPAVFGRQYDFFLELLQKACPRVIVVNNAFVGGFLRNEEKGFFPSRFDTEFDDTIGTCRIKQPLALNGTPIFFSGMITGPHALDKGSKKRLSWHIGYVLEKINSTRSSPT